MKLRVLGEKTVTMTVAEVADLFWIHYDAFTSDSREQRLRVDRGDLAMSGRQIESALKKEKYFDDLIIAIIHSRLRDGNPEQIVDGLGFLAASALEDRWNAGDHDILRRLGQRGIDAMILTQLRSGIWASS